MNTNKKRNIIVFIAFICGFLMGGRVGLIFFIVSRNAGPKQVLFLFYGCIGGGILAGITLFALSVWENAKSQRENSRFFMFYAGLSKRQRLILNGIWGIILVVCVMYLADNILGKWEPTQEKAYAERMSSDETPYSELNILLKREYKDRNIVLAFDKNNCFWLYEFEKRTKNDATEYKYRFSFTQGIISEYTKEDIEMLSIISKEMTESKNISCGATYSDISNLRINGEKPDYVIEEEIDGKKVNVWFYEDLGDDFTIKNAEIEL